MVNFELNVGVFVAVYSVEEPFFLAKIVNGANKGKIKVTWLEKHSVDKNKTLYYFSYDDFIQEHNIITTVNLTKVSRFRFTLSGDEEKRILSFLQDPNPDLDDHDDRNETVSNTPPNSTNSKNTFNNINFDETESLFNGVRIEISEQQKKILLGENEHVAIVLENCIHNDRDKEINVQDEIKVSDISVTTRKCKINTKTYETVENYEELDPPTPAEPYVSSGSEYVPETDEETDHDIPLFEKITFSMKKFDIRNKKEKLIQPALHELEKDILQNVGTNHLNQKNEKEKIYTEKEDETLSISTESESIESNFDRILDETEDEAILVKFTKKNNLGARIYDKRHICYFCTKPVSKMTRHLVDVHSQETEVARLLALPENSTERKEGFLLILRAGDYYHNVEVLSTKKGELILSRRPSDPKYDYKNFGPCPDCLGFFLTTNLWHHVKKNCPKKSKLALMTDDQNVSRRDIRAESYALLGQTSNLSQDFRFHILAHFKNDSVGNICKEDETIIKFGAMLYEKYSEHQHEYVRQSMRQLARLLIEVKKKNLHLSDLKEIMFPKNFDILISSVQQLCIVGKTENNSRTYSIPSLALKIGHNLRKCALIVRGIALRKGDLVLNREMESFLELMTLEWNAKVSSSALRTLKEKKMNATQLLPITDDIMKLNLFLDIIIKDLGKSNRMINSKDWQQLAQATLCRIVLFNKRRSGEAARMTLQQYAVRPSWSAQCTSELKESLSPLENNLANNLTIVEVPGKSKKNFKVPILLTNETKMAVDKLIEMRCSAGISKDNIYVFARGCGSKKPLRGHDCLRKFAKDANLQQPSSLTSTKLRKYIATVAQILDLKENEYDWLARHLGHDIRIHRDFYRLHESAVELTKISRLLLTLDKGEIAKFKGKSLDEIDISELPNIETENADKSDVDDENASDQNNEDEHLEELDNDFGNDNVKTKTQIKEMQKKKELVRSKKILKKNEPERQESHSSKPKSRRAWTSEEKEILLKFFRVNLKKGIIPKKEESQKCLEENRSIFEDRSWKDIKYWIYNKINSLKKQKSKI